MNKPHRSVELLESRIAPATFTVTTNTGTGPGSIYEALDFANFDAGTDTIVFNLPAGSRVITLDNQELLPVLTAKVIIDARTQPGYVDSPLVTIDGGANVAGPGLSFQSSAAGSEVYGLKVTRFGEAGIRVGANDMKIMGCELTANFDGLKISGGENLGVGGPAAAERNVISANLQNGISGVSANGIVIENAYIGVSASGLAAAGNGIYGISLQGASNVTIGGAAKNVISANGFGGIFIEAASGTATIGGNWVGVYADGTFNTASRNLGAGINVSGSATFFVGTDGTDGIRNIVANNQGIGIAVGYSGSATSNIVGNLVGVAPQGASFVAAPNVTGISTQGSGAIRVGGFVEAAFNRIGSNLEYGVTVESQTTDVAGNIFANNGFAPVSVYGNPLPANDDDSNFEGDGITNFPVLAGGFRDDGGVYKLSGAIITSSASTSLRVDIYGYTAATNTYTYVGSTGASTDSDGNGNFLQPVPGIAGFSQIAAIAVTTTSSVMSPLAAFGVGAEIADAHPLFRAEGNTGVQELMFEVRLLESSATQVSVSVGAVAPLDPAPLAGLGVATAGVDYTISPATLTFAPGETSKMVTLTILGDTTAELIEYINLGIVSPVGNVVPTDSQQIVVVTNDDTSLRVAADRKSATWLDVDGDLVTLKATKAVLDAADFQMLVDGPLGGQSLFSLNLSDAGAAAKGVNLSFSAKYDTVNRRGDGSVHVGFIDATGVDLGTVTIPGDLGRIAAGDATLADGSVKSLTLGSWAVVGLNAVDGGGNPASPFRGKLGKLTVAGDFRGAIVADTTADGNAAAGAIGAVAIGGDMSIGGLENTGVIIASGAIGPVKIAGEMRGDRATGPVVIQAGSTLGKVSVGGMHFAEIYAQGNANPLKASAAVAIASVTVRGNVEDSLIAAGRSRFGAFMVPPPLPSNPGAQIGALTVGGDWTRSSAVAGIDAGADGSFGTADDALIAPTSGFTNKPAIVSKIASITVKGHIYGSPGDAASYGFVAQSIGKFTRGTTVLALNSAPAPLDLLGLSIHQDVFLREVS